MKIYLASSFENRLNLHSIRHTLQDMGHEVTSRWLDEAPDISGAEAARIDLEDIEFADALVLLPDMQNFGPGRFVEFGYALALERKMYLIGEASFRGIFFRLPQVTRCENWQHFFEVISAGQIGVSSASF